MEFGTVRIKTDRLTELIMSTPGLGSRNKTAQAARLERSQLNKLLRGETQRIDLAVIARICTVLQCDIDDIFEFIPADD